MRKLSLILVLLLVVGSAWAVPAPRLWINGSDSNGVAIRQGFEIEFDRSADMDGQGNTVYTWSDTRNGDRDVYAQRINSSGVKTWNPSEPNGLLIVHFIDRQEDPSVVATGFGTYIFIWNDFREDAEKGDMYAQCVTDAGALLWNLNGVLVSKGNFDSPAQFRMVADGTGGAILIWNDLRNGNADIFATRIDANGNIPSPWVVDPLWFAGNVVRVRGGSQSQITVDTDGWGGALVAWMDDIDSLGFGRDIYIQRVAQNGALAWGPEGVVVCNATGDQISPKLCPDGANGAFMVWQDYRFDTDGDLYYHHISSSGQPDPNAPYGRVLVQRSNKQQEARIVKSEQNQAVIVWLDDFGHSLIFDVYAQKINHLGAKLWTPLDSGVVVCDEPTNQSEARLSADGAGNVVIVWMDARNGNENQTDNIYTQKLNASGVPVWLPANGKPAVEAPGLQQKPLVRANLNFSMVGWQDHRSGSPGVWYQKLNQSGDPELGSLGDTLAWGIGGNATSPVVVKNTSGRLFYLFQDECMGPVGKTVFFQVMDTVGDRYAQPNGARVCPDPVFTISRSQEKPEACSDGSGGIIAIWCDGRDSDGPNTRLYAQRINENGALMWTGEGKPISPPEHSVSFNDLNWPKIVSDGLGGGWIAWSASIQPEALDIYVARVSPGGTVIGSILTITSTSGVDEFLHDMVSDGFGGAYLAYEGGAWPDQNVYGQYVTSTGSLPWGNNLDLCINLEVQKVPRVVSLGANGAVFCWIDQRYFNSDIYAQKISPAGNRIWTDAGQPICLAPADQTDPDMSVDAEQNVTFVWTDTRIDSNWNIYMQTILADGNAYFPINGAPATQFDFQQEKPRILTDYAGGNYILWEDSRNGASNVNNKDIYGNHLTSTGVPSQWGGWEIGGNAVSTALQAQSGIVMTDDFAQGAVAAWVDRRSSGKAPLDNIYTQRINEFGDAVMDPARNLPEAFRLLSAYPNPFNPDVVLRYTLNHPGMVRLSVWDVMGRQIAVLKDGWQRAGTSSITWDGDDRSSGVYIVRMEYEGRQQQQKIVLLK
jgi:hypothetical protein